MELPTIKINSYKSERKDWIFNEDYDKVKAEIKLEKDLNGDDIKGILHNKFKDLTFVVRSERNVTTVNNAPFDFTIGNPENLELYGCEIKGDTDTFVRLSRQINNYMFACDGIFLTLHKKDPPEWLPEFVGIWRIAENGTVYQERHSYIRDELDISSIYECRELMKVNHLGKNEKLMSMMKEMREIRRNILFNRFFAIDAGYNKGFSKFYPFTEKQKTVLMEFDVLGHYKLVKKDLDDIVDRVEMLKGIINVSQTDVKKIKVKT